ncbi:hypothetical protein BC939DRAFT_463782 [Gamsiella multidivaricata]|uniref:uncharacterized protein n=1 Tax=Gamsiella multidivaricata TaxID=101098 RepID=UPI0022208796|nr:uncharacterized protein BC939DRAFT_463782 [Gamsiella multidivaricata]KAI7818130.1 hypothetical protein BC939DRAFT_463782 [Gamsiella multidivaricata]
MHFYFIWEHKDTLTHDGWASRAMDTGRPYGHPKILPQQHRQVEETPMLTHQDSVFEKEIKQRAATALHDHSVLLLHALTMNETPAKARLRMYRHLTGQPQPPHDYAPAKRKHKEAESSVFSSTSNNPGTSNYSGSSRATGPSSTSSLSISAQGQAGSRRARDIIPVDEEFAHTYFQGPLSS